MSYNQETIKYFAEEYVPMYNHEKLLALPEAEQAKKRYALMVDDTQAGTVEFEGFFESIEAATETFGLIDPAQVPNQIIDLFAPLETACHDVAIKFIVDEKGGFLGDRMMKTPSQYDF